MIHGNDLKLHIHILNYKNSQLAACQQIYMSFQTNMRPKTFFRKSNYKLENFTKAQHPDY